MMMPLLTTAQLLFADPIAIDPLIFADQIKSSHNHHSEEYSEADKARFQEDLGIIRWQVWIQEGPGSEAFCIQSIECQNPSTFQMAFRKEIDQNHFAIWLNDLFQTHLSSKYSLLDPLLKVEKVLDLPIDPENSSPGFDLCYLLPLLPNKVEEHLAYCQAAMNEKREPTIAACKAFGMLNLKKWIQESSLCSYVLYYQKMTRPIDEGRQAFLALKDHPKALQATQTLRDQTGLSFEELSPKTVCISLF